MIQNDLNARADCFMGQVTCTNIELELCCVNNRQKLDALNFMQSEYWGEIRGSGAFS